MLARFVVVGISVVVVAGCLEAESFHGQKLLGGVAGVVGTSGAAGAATLPVVLPPGSGSAGAAGGATADTAGTGGPSIPDAGAAGTTAIGAAGGGGTMGGAAGTMAAAGQGAAGTNASNRDAGAQGGAGTDAAPRDAAPEVSTMPYATTGWKPTASITAAGNADVPMNAFDGNIATRWTTGRAQMGNETFLLDLGAVRRVSRVVLDASTHTMDFPAAYTLEVSTNGMTFTTATMGTGMTVTDIQFTRVMARYVQIRQTGKTPTSWWSVDELEIYP